MRRFAIASVGAGFAPNLTSFNPTLTWVDSPQRCGRAGKTKLFIVSFVDKEISESELTPERWLDEHGDLLFRIAITKVRDSSIAEDLVQETLVSAWKSRNSFEGRSSESTWLVGILRRRIADHFRSETRRRRLIESHQDDSQWHGEPTDSPFSIPLSPAISNEKFESSLEAKEFLGVVQECLAQMPVHLRQAFHLRLTYPELDVAELSQKLGITSNNLSVRLYRARLLMRYCVERKWSQ